MNKYEQLFKLVDEMNELQKEVVILREDIFQEVLHNKKGKIINEHGIFQKVINKDWLYPKSVTDKEAIAKRKIAKIKEKVALVRKCSQKYGNATFEEKPALRIIRRK